MLAVFLRRRVGQTHEDHYLAVGMTDAGTPPLAAVQHHIVALNRGGGLHVGGVAGGHRRLGHAERRANLPGQQRFEPSVLLRLGAVLDQHFHVAGVRRIAVEDFRGHRGAAGDFGQRRIIGVTQAGAIFLFRQKQVPQAGGFGLGLQFLHDRRLFPLGPVRAVNELLLVNRLGGHHLLSHEGVEAFEVVACFSGIGEVHGIVLSSGYGRRIPNRFK